MKKLILIIIVVLIFSGIGYAQINNLSDRELLIQLYAKTESIEKAIYNLNSSAELNRRDVFALDKRVTTNETNFAGFCKRFDELTVRWNTLITIFFASLLGMVIWMFRRAYTSGNRKEIN